MKKKALLIIPEMYSIKNVVRQGLEELGYDVRSIDYRKILRKNILIAKLHTVLMFGRDKFPGKQKKVNRYFIKEFNQYTPDIVIAYNDELLLPPTIDFFGQSAKIIFLLGDNPLTLSPPNRYNVDLLFKADIVVCADSTWKRQLERIGLDNIIYDYVSYVPTLYVNDTNTNQQERKHDILFVGRTYGTAWGYKRCLFLNQFTDLNIDIYGTGAHWPKWYKMFPKIEKRMIKYSKKKIPFTELKSLMHSYKIFPVDINPGIISGTHLRVFECIAAGILPLIEHTEDLDYIFKDISLPIITNYSKCKQVALEYLNDDEKRIETLRIAREFLNDNYSPSVVIQRIMNKV